LGARCNPADIRKAVCNGFIECHQKAAGRLLSANVQKSAKPFPYIVILIRALSPHTRRQVRELLGGVLERVKLGVFLDLEVRCIFGRVFEPNGAFHVDVRAGCIKIEKRDAVAEYVVNPPNASGLGRNRQIRAQKPLIETVARTKHQAMFSEANGPFIPVFCQVSNYKNGPRRFHSSL
jgi:hypothetical protein